MWRSRLRAIFLSTGDVLNAGEKPAIIHENGYDIHRLLYDGVYFSKSTRY